MFTKNVSRELIAVTALSETSRRREQTNLRSKKDEAPNGLLSVRRFRSFLNCLR